MKYLFIVLLFLSKINAFSQTEEKFMKLQRIFSFDTSAKVTNTAIAKLFHSKTVPANTIWILKNVNYTSGGLSEYATGTGVSYNMTLGVTVNTSPLFSQRALSNSTTQGAVTAAEPTGAFYATGPIIITSSKKLTFLYNYPDSQGPEIKLHLYYTVEEYIID